MDRQTLYFTVANFPYTRIKLSKSQNSNETRRIWGVLAAPDFANSGKQTCAFPDVNSNSREKCIEYIFHIVKNLHKEMHMFFSTIGDDGSRQYCSVSPIFVRLL